MSQTVKNPTLSIHNKVGGFIREFRVLNVETGVERVIKGPKNRVVDNGLDMFGQLKIGLLSCWLSTNNTAVSDAETQVSGTAAKNTAVSSTVGSQLAASPIYVWREMSYTFALGAATGVWSSVCIGLDALANGLFARALITDDEGDPTTLTVAANEILTVVYQLRIYIPESDSVASFDIGAPSVATEIRGRVAGAASWAGIASNYYLIGLFYAARVRGSGSVLGGINGAPSGGTGTDDFGVTLAPYVVGSFRSDATLSLSYSQANYTGGIATVQIYVSPTNAGAVGPKNFQISFTPPIAKDNTKNLAITVRNSWGRW